LFKKTHIGQTLLHSFERWINGGCKDKTIAYERALIGAMFGNLGRGTRNAEAFDVAHRLFEELLGRPVETLGESFNHPGKRNRARCFVAPPEEDVRRIITELRRMTGLMNDNTFKRKMSEIANERNRLREIEISRRSIKATKDVHGDDAVPNVRRDGAIDYRHYGKWEQTKRDERHRFAEQYARENGLAALEVDMIASNLYKLVDETPEGRYWALRTFKNVTGKDFSAETFRHQVMNDLGCSMRYAKHSINAVMMGGFNVGLSQDAHPQKQPSQQDPVKVHPVERHDWKDSRVLLSFVKLCVRHLDGLLSGRTKDAFGSNITTESANGARMQFFTSHELLDLSRVVAVVRELGGSYMPEHDGMTVFIDPELAKGLIDNIEQATDRRWTIKWRSAE